MSTFLAGAGLPFEVPPAGKLVAGCLVLGAAAVLVRRAPRRPRRRLSRVQGRSPGRWHPHRWPFLPARVSGSLDLVRGGAGLVGFTVAVMVGGWFGLLGGGATAVALDRGLRRLEPVARRRQRAAEAATLPLAADLLAVALRGGAPVDRAASAVADVLPGPLGERLARVGRVLALGGAPAEAWAQFAVLAGGDRVARAAIRSAEHGSALADALSRLAGDLRADRADATEAAARRRGVLMVLPLGLCFLPAFVLAGLIPVVLAVLGEVLRVS